MNKIVIGFTGLAGSGKSTAARILRKHHGFTVLPFAGPLKAMALAYGLTPEELGPDKERAFSRSLPGIGMDLAHAMLRKLPFNSFHDAGEPTGRVCITNQSRNVAALALCMWWHDHRKDFTTPRRFMQLLGTEWGRDMIGHNFWADIWRASLGESAAEHFGDILAVADDARFENEAAAIRSEGGIIVRVERAGAGSATGASHSSEAGVVPDITLENDGDEAEFTAKVLGLLDRWFAGEAI